MAIRKPYDWMKYIKAIMKKKWSTMGFNQGKDLPVFCFWKRTRRRKSNDTVEN